MHSVRSLWKAALFDLGRWVAVPSLMGVVMTPCAFVLDGWRAGLPFLLMAIVLGAIAAGAHWSHRRRTSPLLEEEDEGAATAAAAIGIGLAWLVFVSVCAVPFYSMAAWHSTAGAYGTVVDALFESISGLTTCGLSMASDANVLPHTLQLWRSVLQWFGGVGVIVLALTVLDHASDPEALVGAEVGGGSFAEDATQTAKRIWKIYAAITAIACIGYLGAGLHWWEAVNLAMTTASTGGFAVTSNSFADYGWGPRLVACVIMIASALSFALYDDLLRRNWRKVFGSSQTWTLFAVLLLGMGLIVAFTDQSTGQVLFQWCSAVTTCGLTTTGTLEEWTPVALLIFAGAMAMGGCAGSTTGGFKTLRLVRVTKAMGLRLWGKGGGTLEGPAARLAEEDLDDEERRELSEMLQAGNFIFLYVVSWSITMLLLAATLEEEYAVGQLLFDSASALSAVGLSAGLISADMPTSAKVVVEVAMWVGRLEVVGGLAMVFALLRSVVSAIRPARSEGQ